MTHASLLAITERIVQRSAHARTAYLQRLDQTAQRAPGMQRLGCSNIAHTVAGLPGLDKIRVVAHRAPHIGIVTAYNDMLSAHAPFQTYPDIIKDEARQQGATAQVATGVPAMCDGITQGYAGMELSLFSRDVIAMATAVGLSHDVFDAALMLGVCDKIVPGLLIGALHFGHLPVVFVPAGPMASGISNAEKAHVREQAAQGLVGRDELLQAETGSYHSPGTCTFYGTANSNQMLMEAMGLHVPGSAFVHPASPVRDALTREAVRTVLANTQQQRYTPIGRLVDERAIVNAMVVLLATGGSTNHFIHWIAVARSSGITINWDDFDSLARVVPLLCRMYPNGQADVNQFQSAGGTGFVIRELLDAGLLHADVLTVHVQGLRAYTREPVIAGTLQWRDAPALSRDDTVVRGVSQPFKPDSGMHALQGNLGRSVIKLTAVPEDRHLVEAPALVFDSQEAVLEAFAAGELERDFICVVRWQGPRANGMPELHKLTPPLSVLQKKGWRVALVTDGRMSGASGQVPAAIHVCPEALAEGPLARVRDGDLIRLDALTGQLNVLVSEAEWAAREPASYPSDQREAHQHGLGRELFANFRSQASAAEEGACSW